MTTPKTRLDAGRVKRAVQAGVFKGLGHAAAYVRRVARNSVKRSKRPSAPGSPPHTRRGAIKRAMRYAVEKGKGRAVVGVSADLLGPAGKPHEKGGGFRGQRYPKRPFMVPALLKSVHRMPSFWRSTVTGR